MIIVQLKYTMSNKMDGRNWALVVEHDGKYKYTETLKFTTNLRVRCCVSISNYCETKLTSQNTGMKCEI